MRKPPTWKVPFDRAGQPAYGPNHPARPPGSMLDYAYSGGGVFKDTPQVEWREPYEFTERLYLLRSGRGRSAVTFTLSAINGITYPMKLAAFTDMVLATTIYVGAVSGRWGFAKRGENYSLVFLGETT